MCPPIRIAFVIDEIGQATDGTEIQVLQMIQRLDPQRFRAHLVALRPSPALDATRTCCEVKQLHVSRLFSPRGIKALFTLRSWLRANRVSIVQTFFKDANVLGLLAAALAGVPLRLSSRRSLPYEDRRRDKLIYKLMDPFVHYYMANGSGVRDHLTCVEGVAPERVRVFYNVLDRGIEKLAAGRDHPTRREHVVFLMVANFRPVKGHAFLIESVLSVRARLPHARFVLVGGGPRGEPGPPAEIRDIVARAGLTDSFVFEGLQTDLGRFLALADVGLLCSSSEGFSSALLEYLAMGLPCIATDVGSNRETVLDGWNGFLVPYGNREALGRALVALHDNENLRRAMGQRGRSHFEGNFQPATQMEMLERFYRAEVEARP